MIEFFAGMDAAIKLQAGHLLIRIRFRKSFFRGIAGYMPAQDMGCGHPERATSPVSPYRWNRLCLKRLCTAIRV